MAALALPTKRLLTRAEAAQYCRLEVKKFDRLAARAGVAPIDLEGSLRYDVRALDRWLDSLAAGREALSEEDWLGESGVGQEGAALRQKERQHGER